MKTVHPATFSPYVLGAADLHRQGERAGVSSAG